MNGGQKYFKDKPIFRNYWRPRMKNDFIKDCEYTIRDFPGVVKYKKVEDGKFIFANKEETVSIPFGFKYQATMYLDFGKEFRKEISEGRYLYLRYGGDQYILKRGHITGIKLEPGFVEILTIDSPVKFSEHIEEAWKMPGDFTYNELLEVITRFMQRGVSA
jgi:hypothetical protein